jgi:hypothetical protein
MFYGRDLANAFCNYLFRISCNKLRLITILISRARILMTLKYRKNDQ